MSVFHPDGQYDGKTLIRHAMVALEDEFGTNEADQFNNRLRQIFAEIRTYEASRQKKRLERIGSDHGRFVEGGRS